MSGALSGLFGSSSDGYGHCCPPVFDPYTLIALIGGIALATYFLRLVIVTTTFTGRSLGLGNPFSKYSGEVSLVENLIRTSQVDSWKTPPGFQTL